MTTHTKLLTLTLGCLFLTSSVFGEVVRDFPGDGEEMGLSLPSANHRQTSEQGWLLPDFRAVLCCPHILALPRPGAGR